MRDAGTVLERIGNRVPVPQPAFDRLMRRRERKRRNARIRAAAVVVATVLLVIVVGVEAIHGRSPVPAEPAPVVHTVGAGLWEVDPDTGKITRVPGATYAVSRLDVSPDGNEILFTSPSSPDGFPSSAIRRSQFVIENVDGTGIHSVASIPETSLDVDVAWSPSGNEIAFESSLKATRSSPARRDLFVMNADGRDMRVVTHTRTTVFRSPAWSPDGSKLAFFTEGRRGFDIGVVDVRSGATSMLTSDAASASPAWSPDGKWIAYSRGVPGSGERAIWLMHPDGSDQHLLVQDRATDRVPTWSPDGRRIAFCATDLPPTDGCSIAIVDVATGVVRTVAKDAGLPLDWSPRGYLVVSGFNPDSNSEPRA